MSAPLAGQPQTVKIGAYLMLLGQGIIAGSSAVLMDTTIGSPRQVGVTLGAFLTALGAYFVGKGH